MLCSFLQMYINRMWVWSLKSDSLVFVRGIRFLCHAFFVWEYKKGDVCMQNYKELYFELFNKVTDIIDELKQIKQDMEDKYTESVKESE